jgi:hypothetical protein
MPYTYTMLAAAPRSPAHMPDNTITWRKGK